MWMDLYDLIRKPVILAGIAMFGVAFLMLVRDYIRNENRKGSAVSMVLIVMLVALAASMI